MTHRIIDERRYNPDGPLAPACSDDDEGAYWDDPDAALVDGPCAVCGDNAAVDDSLCVMCLGRVDDLRGELA